MPKRRSLQRMASAGMPVMPTNPLYRLPAPCVHSEGFDYSACCAAQAGQIESAVGLWRHMHAEGAQPSTDQCNALLTACLDCQHNERALTLFQEVQAMGEGWPGLACIACCARVELCIVSTEAAGQCL